MVHDIKCLRNILVQAGLRQVVRHVVEEVDVGERPAGEGLCVRANLGNEDGGWRNDDKNNSQEGIRKNNPHPTCSIISAQLLCFRGTITSSTSKRAIHSYLTQLFMLNMMHIYTELQEYLLLKTKTLHTPLWSASQDVYLYMFL